MMPFRRRRSSSWFWIAVALCGGGLSGLVTFLVTCLVLLLLVLAIFAHLPTAPAAVGSEGMLTASQAWTGLRNQPVVDEALHVASGLYNGPPDGLDTWYHADLIPDALAYWQRTCPGCAAWAEGSLQCVMLITAAYGLAGQPLPYVGNAITFWSSGAYLHRPGWEEVAPTALPYPGDIIVLSSPFFGGVGHVVIVVDVKPPDPAGAGFVAFAEANGPGPVVQEPLTQDGAGGLHLAIWRQYTVMTYIRHTVALAR